MNISKGQREQIRMMFGGRCAYCGIELPEKGWHADHVEPVFRQWWKKHLRITYELTENGPIRHEEKQAVGMDMAHRDTIENLFPCCRSCNIDKGANSLKTWRRRLADLVGCLRRNYPTYRHAERFGLVAVNEKPIVFWFEQYQAERGSEAKP